MLTTKEEYDLYNLELDLCANYQDKNYINCADSPVKTKMSHALCHMCWLILELRVDVHTVLGNSHACNFAF